MNASSFSFLICKGLGVAAIYGFLHVPAPVYSADLTDVVRSSVVVVSGPAADGSGVVVGRKGNTYILLTAKHVVGAAGADEADVLSKAGASLPLKIIKAFPATDLAIATFSSEDQYVPMPINAFLPSPPPPLSFNGSRPFTVENGPSNKFVTVTTMARVAGYSLPTRAVNVRVFRFIDSNFVDLIAGNSDGYDLLYQASTVAGMSGGPVMGFRDCTNGSGFALGISPYSVFPALVGIHGRSEDYSSGEGRSGISLGIPVNGEVLNYLKQISVQHGIPMGEAQMRPMINRYFCIGASVLPATNDLEQLIQRPNPRGLGVGSFGFF